MSAFNSLDEKGVFTELGEYAERIARIQDNEFIDEFKKKNALIETTKVEHEYPHCWRCDKPVVFRATEQWFLRIEDLIPKLVKDNKDIAWVPKFGSTAFDSWLNALRDNSITRQRFWGTPVPIWECGCGNIIVVGSKKELEKIATTKVPDDLHKEDIDDVKVKCSCGKEAVKVPDVLDVWIDAGTLGFNCLDYPAKDKDFKEYFPADLILEATEQVRLWFSMLHICSEVALGKKCFNNVYMHGMILDYQGIKMSKSLGNIISPYEVVDQYGADVLRYYMCQVRAGENINFSW